jgi:hypothetical protein
MGETIRCAKRKASVFGEIQRWGPSAIAASRNARMSSIPPRNNAKPNVGSKQNEWAAPANPLRDP